MLITFDNLNDTRFWMNITGFIQTQTFPFTKCQKADKLTTIVPDSFDIPETVCVFGSSQAWVDGTYQFVAWNEDMKGGMSHGPIYYNSLEDKYLYGMVFDDTQIRIHMSGDYTKEDSDSFCINRRNDPNRYNVENCVEWYTDINTEGVTDYKKDPNIIVQSCQDLNKSTDLNESITFGFEMEQVTKEPGDEDERILQMTFFWHGSAYKCTVYPTNYDTYYSCNTLLNALKCDGYKHVSHTDDYQHTIKLQIDVFGDDEKQGYNDDKGDEEGFEIKKVFLKHMSGNVLLHTNIIEKFCENGKCSDLFRVVNQHNVISFHHDQSVHEAQLEDQLDADVTYTQSDTKCIPNGYAHVHNNETKYLLVNETLKWEDAQRYCEEHFNSGLATIISDADLQSAVALREIHLLGNPEDIWIGLNDRNKKKVFEWVDGTTCDYVKPTESCKDDTHWAPEEPDEDTWQDCVQMSGVSVFGYYSDDSCDEKHPFLCDVPTAAPTMSPTQSPTAAPIRMVNTDNIIIVNHPQITSEWIAFKLQQEELNCGGEIYMVEISDKYPYDGYVWYKYTGKTLDGYYEFDLKNNSFSSPVSIRITRRSYNNRIESLLGSHVLEKFDPKEQFDFQSNFCSQEPCSNILGCESIFAYPYHIFIYLLILSIYCLVVFSAYLDSKIGFRQNDHFDATAILSSLFQTFDMLSDIFFVLAVYQTNVIGEFVYDATKNSQLMIIFVLSVLFIVIPIMISLYQLHIAAHKQWLDDNRVREWLKRYTRLLYFHSICTGSSFSSIQMFNSNLFGLDFFYMGLNRNNLMNFSAQKLYSIVLFENIPQLFVSIWYSMVIGRVSGPSIIQIIFSFTSIVVTIITAILHTRIYKTQDFVHITFDVSGQCIMQNLKTCKNKTKFLQKYLAREVLGVNAKWVDIRKPYAGAIKNGIQIQIYISFVHVNKNNQNNMCLENYYKYCLQKAVNSGQLANILMKRWRLNSIPEINYVCCQFTESLMSKQNKANSKKHSATDEIRELKIDENSSNELIDIWSHITNIDDTESDDELNTNDQQRISSHPL